VTAPLVTVITPSLNQGRFIEETIRSVLGQQYRPIEHLVLDGGSSDETPRILERYGDRIRFSIAPDGGQADAINRGIAETRGEIVAWLNADDLYAPGAVGAAVDELSRRPASAMVYGTGRFIDAEGRDLGPYPTAPPERLRSGCVVCQPAAFMRRDAVVAVGLLDPTLRYCMDYDLWLRLAARFELAHVSGDFARYRLHATAKSVRERLAFMREVMVMTRRRLGASPLFYIYAYANLLVTERLGALPAPVRRALAGTLAAFLAARYHPLPSFAALREARAFERGPWPTVPPPGQAAADDARR
jgi:glycosyltransferase involved in cell wall biosynthesis